MKQGWISVHRQIQDNWVWQDKPFSQGQAWIDLLLMANHSDSSFPLGQEIVSVKTGSFITSELKLMERWGWSKSKVRRFLSLLENDSMIVKNTDRKKTAITIVNYGIFQNVDTKKELLKDHKKTDSRPKKDTNNNVNNEDNENTVNKLFVPPTLYQVQEYCNEINSSINPAKFVDYYTANGWHTGKTKMVDWKAALRTWENN